MSSMPVDLLRNASDFEQVSKVAWLMIWIQTLHCTRKNMSIITDFEARSSVCKTHIVNAEGLASSRPAP